MAASPSKKRSKTLFFSYDDSPTANPANVLLLQKQVRKEGYFILEHTGKTEVDESVKESLSRSIAIIICVSKEYHLNRNCKLLATHAQSLINRKKNSAFEVLFVMTQGHYTTISQPYKVEGWLKYMIKDSLWYPSWSSTHISGACEAIRGVISLLAQKIDIDDPEMRHWKEDIEKFGSPKKKSASSMRSPSSSRPTTAGTSMGSVTVTDTTTCLTSPQTTSEEPLAEFF